MTLTGFPRRVMGEEDEYGFVVLYLNENGKWLPIKDPSTYAKKLMGAEITFRWFENGALFYIDVGAHPEIATAECLDGWQVAAQSRWGEQWLVSQISLLQKEFPHLRFKLFKNNVTEDLNTHGCHESYLTKRRLSIDEIAGNLAAFMVTRSLITGSGVVFECGNSSYRFELSQRAHRIEDFIGGVTTSSGTGKRALFNTRDQTLANETLYRRLHLICGDSNILWTPSWLKFEITALMLLLLENNSLPYIELNDPVTELHRLSKNYAVKLLLASGHERTATEIQWAYYRVAEQFVVNHNLTQFSYALLMWKAILEAFSRHDLYALEGSVDWVTKLLNINRRESKRELTYRQARALDIGYHCLYGSPTKPGLSTLTKAEAIRLKYDPDNTADWLKWAATGVPATKAALRSQFLAAAKKSRYATAVDWEWLVVDAGEVQQAYNTSDPFQYQSAAVDRLVDILDSSPKAQRM